MTNSKLNLYLLTQDVNSDYDTYDSAVVAAKTEEEARMIHPAEFENPDRGNWLGIEEENWSSWCDAENVTVLLIGTADKSIKKGVVISSFNAG